MRNYLFVELHFLPPVVKVTTSFIRHGIQLFGFFFKGKANRLAHNIFKWLFRRSGLKCARLWGVTVSCVTRYRLMKSPCSKMQWSSAKLLGTPATILDWVICNLHKKLQRWEEDRHSRPLHVQPPNGATNSWVHTCSTCLFCPRPGEAAGNLQLAAGWASLPGVLSLQRKSSNIHGISDCTSLTN